MITQQTVTWEYVQYNGRRFRCYSDDIGRPQVQVMRADGRRWRIVGNPTTIEGVFAKVAESRKRVAPEQKD